MRTHTQYVDVDLIDVRAAAHFGVDTDGKSCVVSVEVFGIEFTSGPVFELIAEQAEQEKVEFLSAA